MFGVMELEIVTSGVWGPMFFVVGNTLFNVLPLFTLVTGGEDREMNFRFLLMLGCRLWEGVTGVRVSFVLE